MKGMPQNKLMFWAELSRRQEMFERYYRNCWTVGKRHPETTKVNEIEKLRLKRIDAPWILTIYYLTSARLPLWCCHFASGSGATSIKMWCHFLLVWYHLTGVCGDDLGYFGATRVDRVIRQVQEKLVKKLAVVRIPFLCFKTSLPIYFKIWICCAQENWLEECESLKWLNFGWKCRCTWLNNEPHALLQPIEKLSAAGSTRHGTVIHVILLIQIGEQSFLMVNHMVNSESMADAQSMVESV